MFFNVDIIKHKAIYLTKNEGFYGSKFLSTLIFVKVRISIKNFQENYVFCNSLKKRTPSLKKDMKRISVLVTVILSLFVVSCGEKKEEKKETFEITRAKTEEPKEVESDENVVALASTDLMSYDKQEIRVKAGKKVTLTLRHMGKMAKNVMGHNFVLLKEGTDVAAFATAAMSARDTDYIPESDAIIANTKIIGGGESVTITFDAPEVGTYDFICSFPGHYAMMKGKFIVE